jgi:hypothetical protein
MMVADDSLFMRMVKTLHYAFCCGYNAGSNRPRICLDSIPAVMGISRDKLVIYTSNILQCWGCVSLFFLIRGAVSKFDYLPQGIAIVLIFIGLQDACRKLDQPMD